MEWTEVSKPKKKKVQKQTVAAGEDQKNIMKEMQGFKNWAEKETKSIIPANTGITSLDFG